MRLHWLAPSLIALALGVFQPRFALAEAESTPSTAVLGLEAIDVPNSLTDEMSEQLRQRVSSAKDLHLVSGKDLVEVKLVFGCADEAASCMAQAGKSLDAQKLIYGSVKRSGDDYALWLKMFDVRRARIEFWLTETLPRKSADAAGIKAASVRWLAKLTGRTASGGGATAAAGTGTLRVSANVSGATVSLDGVPAGATTDQPLAITDVRPGKHELVIEKPGHIPLEQVVVVAAAGQTVPVHVTLRAKPASETGPVEGRTGPPPLSAQAADSEGVAATARAGQDTTPSDGRAGYRTGFWVTLAAGLATAGAAVKFGLDVADVNKRLNPYRRFPCMGNQLCDGDGAVRPPLTPAERNSVSTLNDEGNRHQTLQWICVGVGSVLGIASGYLLYKGYIDSDDDPGRRQARSGLRIFPTAGVSGSGIVAEFEF